MGGQSTSTPQGNGSQLSQLFSQNTGYQQPNQVAPIAQPQYPAALTPSPEQAAAATQARLTARTPMTAPKGAPLRPQGNGNDYSNLTGRGNLR